MNAVKYTLPKSGDELLKIQDKAIRAANNARILIQQALVGTVHHLAIHHDVRMANRLVDGLRETVRGKAIVEYLTKYGHLTVGDVEVEVDGKAKTVQQFTGLSVRGGEAHAKVVRETFEEAKATLWWTLKRENPYAGFDMQKALDTVIKHYQTALKKVQAGEVGEEKLSTEVNDTTIRALLAIVKFDTIAEPANVELKDAA